MGAIIQHKELNLEASIKRPVFENGICKLTEKQLNAVWENFGGEYEITDLVAFDTNEQDHFNDMTRPTPVEFAA